MRWYWLMSPRARVWYVDQKLMRWRKGEIKRNEHLGAEMVVDGPEEKKEH